MKYNHYYLILINFIFKKIIKKKNSLRILNYHNIPTSKISNFEKQIQFIIKNYDIISPEQLGTKDINKKIKKRVLITFDDGYKSVLNALPVLKKYNIYAIFFIIGDFIQIKNDYEIKNFIANNISPKLYDKNLLNEKNLNKEDIISLVKEGHTIGYHTKSHKNLGIIKNHKYISDQINNEIDLFGDKKFTQQINHFSFPFGSIENINRENYKIIKDKYKYIFSGLRGDNNNLLSSKKIFRRDEISPDYNIHVLESILNGFADTFYANKIKELDKMTDV